MTTTNRVILTGRIASSPRRSSRPDGTSVVQFPLELNQEEGPSLQSGPSLIDIVAFGELGGPELDHLQNGQRLHIEGRLNQRRWQTPEGKHRTRLEVIATVLQLVAEAGKSARGERK